MNADVKPLPRLVRINLLCSWSGVTRNKLYQLWRDGRGPQRLLIDNVPVVRREDAENWMTQMVAEASRPDAPTKSTRGNNPRRTGQNIVTRRS